MQLSEKVKENLYKQKVNEVIPTITWESLPSEVIYHIMTYLSAANLLRARRVSWQFNHFSVILIDWQKVAVSRISTEPKLEFSNIYSIFTNSSHDLNIVKIERLSEDDLKKNVRAINLSHYIYFRSNYNRYEELVKKLGLKIAPQKGWTKSINNLWSMAANIANPESLIGLPQINNLSENTINNYKTLTEVTQYGFDLLLHLFFTHNPKFLHPPRLLNNHSFSNELHYDENVIALNHELLTNAINAGYMRCFVIIHKNINVMPKSNLIQACKVALHAKQFEIFNYVLSHIDKTTLIFDYSDFLESIGDGSDYRFADIIFNQFQRFFDTDTYSQIANKAMSNNHFQILEYLILSINTNEQAQWLEWLIKLAISLNMSRSLKFILCMEQFKFLENSFILTIIDQVVKMNQIENLRLLITCRNIDLNHKVADSYVLETSIKFSTPEIVLQLIISGASVDLIPSALYLLTQRACNSEQDIMYISKIAQFLIKEGSSVNGVESDKLYPLNEAIKSGNIHLVRLLLNHKDINLNLKDINGLTALEVAQNYAMNALKSNTVDINLRNEIYFEIRYAQKTKGNRSSTSEASHTIMYTNSSSPSANLPVAPQLLDNNDTKTYPAFK